MLHRFAFVVGVGLGVAACGGKHTAAPASGATTAPVPSASAVDETIAGVGLNDPAAKVEAAFGPPAQKGELVTYEATGDTASMWTWPDQGLSIDMSQTPSGFVVSSLAVTAPSALTTSRGIGIGAPWADVDRTYSPFKGEGLQDGEEQTWSPDQILVGSLYGGTSFMFTDGTVSGIFIGAGAE
jgi:hypothetical protein